MILSQSDVSRSIKEKTEGYVNVYATRFVVFVFLGNLVVVFFRGLLHSGSLPSHEA